MHTNPPPLPPSHPMTAMTISKETMSHYFHLPIDRAAKQLNVGLSVFKQQCRQVGIQRWPYRKLRSLQKMIADFQVRNQINLIFWYLFDNDL